MGCNVNIERSIVVRVELDVARGQTGKRGFFTNAVPLNQDSRAPGLPLRRAVSAKLSAGNNRNQRLATQDVWWSKELIPDMRINDGLSSCGYMVVIRSSSGMSGTHLENRAEGPCAVIKRLGEMWTGDEIEMFSLQAGVTDVIGQKFWKRRYEGRDW
jgi:hypothetical protein